MKPYFVNIESSRLTEDLVATLVAGAVVQNTSITITKSVGSFNFELILKRGSQETILRKYSLSAGDIANYNEPIQLDASCNLYVTGTTGMSITMLGNYL